jgi:5-methylcytosine-specific restriction enzyme A
MPRAFRTDESFAAERITRDMLPQFLRERGYSNVEDQRKSFGLTQSQVIHGTDENGNRLALSVRLCWRHSGRREAKDHYSAAQLLAKIKNNDWIGSIKTKLANARRSGATHLLLVQRHGNGIQYAAQIPIDAVLPIWKKQRDISVRVIRSGALGARTKNHAMNGASPTLWLQDRSAPDVAKALWDHPGVRDLARLPAIERPEGSGLMDDSIDDLGDIAYGDVGSDGAARVQRITSGVRRDPRVRQAVRARSGGTCERTSCRTSRPYAGFLDVHHILGADTSDRIWNCVALCPNCHREAHTDPNRDRINAELLAFASQFARPSRSAPLPAPAEGRSRPAI